MTIDTAARMPRLPLRRLQAAQWAALLLAVTGLGAGLVNAVGALLGDTVTVSITASVPIRDALSTAGPEGMFTAATVPDHDPSMGLRVLTGAADLVGALAWVGLLVALAVLCNRLLSGRAFARSGTAAAWIAALSLAVGGLLAQLLQQGARLLASTELNLPLDAFPLTLEWDLSLIVIGIVFAIVAVILSSGERLQRDTDGLV